MNKTKITLSDTFSLRGQWWLPDTPDRKVFGDVKFSQDGTSELELNGTIYKPKQKREIPSNFTAPIVHGQLLDGSFCTLYDTFESFWQLGANAEYSRLIYNEMLIGDDLINPSAGGFDYAVIEFDGLNAWIGGEGFDVSESGNETKITKSDSELFSVIVDSIKARISVFLGHDKEISYYEYMCKCNAMLIIEPVERREKRWYLDNVFNFQILLSLLIGESVIPIAIRFFKRVQENHERRTDYSWKFFIRLIRSRRKTELLPVEVLFPLDKLENDFNMIMNRWYNNSEKLKTISSLHFGVQVNDRSPIEYQFLTLIQALESYSREDENHYITKDQYEPIRKALVSAIPMFVVGGFKKSLERKIEFGYEYSLIKRLNIIRKTLSKEIANSIGFTEDFISKTKDTRNYLIHRDTTTRQEIFGPEELFKACERLKLLISIILLKETGLDQGFIIETMRNSFRFAQKIRFIL